MSKLEVFFKENTPQEEHKKVLVSERFFQDGQPVYWEIKSISSAEDEILRRGCVRKKRGNEVQDGSELDFDFYIGKLAAMCTVFPNLNDVQLQNSYGVMGADSLLKEMLKPGEYANYIEKIQEINGFTKTMKELVDEAKN